MHDILLIIIIIIIILFISFFLLSTIYIIFFFYLFFFARATKLPVTGRRRGRGVLGREAPLLQRPRLLFLTRPVTIMRYDSSTYSTLNPADKWKSLPQHQNINSRNRVFPRQQQQQQSSLALNGANVFKNGNHAMSKRYIQPTAANMQYHSNRSYLQFAGKAKIHVPRYRTD